MVIRALALLVVAVAAAACTPARRVESSGSPAAEPLVLGQTFTIDSKALGEARRVNVYVPTLYGQPFEAPLPVLYMPDGGMDEDFVHVAGLVQVLVSNGGMRPFVLVGIPNTLRRRDLTGPTTNPEDRKIAPEVGGSAAYRRFIRDELKPAVRARYRTTEESAIVGESLAGLFVLETYFLEPDLFDTYIAIDPSVWWADGGLVKAAEARLGTMRGPFPSVYVATSIEPGMTELVGRLAGLFAAHPDVPFVYEPFPGETHATIYHPAALRAFRLMLAPPAAGG